MHSVRSVAASLPEAQTDFAFGVLSEIAANHSDTSVVFSPFSVAMVLAMVYAGAEEKTADQLASALGGRGASRDAIHAHFAALLQSVGGASNANYTLEAANRAYAADKFDILDSYTQTIRKYYGGQFESVDFSESEKTSELINDFVAEKTHDKIKDLVSPDDIGPDTMLLLLNAVYFKGSWADKFDAKKTKNASFFVSEHDVKQVEMMKKSGKNIRYFESSNIQAISLPYAGNKLFAHFILPLNRFGLDDVLDSFDRDTFADLVANDRTSDVDITLPKFRVESTHNLQDALQNLGVTNIFSSEANLSGMSSKPLYVNAIVQKAFIKTDEEGSEAAAATFAGVRMLSAQLPERFVADQPFIFLLADASQNIFFAGVIRGD